MFERVRPARKAISLPDLDVPGGGSRAGAGRGERARRNRGFPEVSEVEVIRHFTRLSTWNYAIDLGLYPLGSCTMKYNPRVNEAVARIDGLAWAHPYQPESLSQGAMEVMARAGSALPKSPAWTRSRCSRRRARTAN
jgi:glycine dehydrogenase subunit 2